MVLGQEPAQDPDQPGPRQGDAARGWRPGSDVQEDGAAQPGNTGSVVGNHGRVVVGGYLMHRLGTGAGMVPAHVDPLVVAGAGRVIVPVVVGVGVPEGESEIKPWLDAEEEAEPV